MSAQPNEGRPQGGEMPEVSSVLKDFEAGLESLRSLYQQRQALQQALKEREDALQQRDKALRERDSVLEQRTRELTDLTYQFDAQVREMEKSRQDVTQREQACAARLQDAECRQQAAQEAQARAEKDASAAERAQQSVQQAHTEVERIRAEVLKSQEELAGRVRTLDERARALSEQQKGVEEHREKIASYVQELAGEKASLLDERAQFKAMGERAGELERACKGLENESSQLKSRLAASEQRGAEEAKAAAQLRDRCAALEAKLEELTSALAEEKAARTQLAKEYELRLTSELNIAKRAAETQLAEAAKQRDALAAKAAADARQIEEAFAAKAREAAEQARREVALAIEQSKENVARVREQAQREVGEAQAKAEREAQRVQETAQQWEQRARAEREQQKGVLEAGLAASIAAAVAEATQRADASWKARSEQLLGEQKKEADRAIAEAQQRVEAVRREQEQHWKQQQDAMKESFARTASSELAHSVTQAREAAAQEWQAKLAQALEQERANAGAQAKQLQQQLEAMKSQAQQRLEQEVAQQRQSLLSEGKAAGEKAVVAARQEAEQAFGVKLAQALDAERRAHAAALAKASDEAAARAKREVAEEATRQVDEIKKQFARKFDEQLSLMTTGSSEEVDRDWKQKMDAAVSQERAQREQLVASMGELVTSHEALWGEEKAQTTQLIQRVREAMAKHDDAQVLAALTEALAQHAGNHAATQRALSESGRQLEEASGHIENLREQLSEALKRPVAGPNETPSSYFTPETVAFLQRRHKRLRKMHTLLKDQTDKVRKGSEALRSRYEQCEVVLRHRSEVSVARERVIEAEKRVQKAAARSKVAVVMLAAAGTVGIVGALSWALAKQVAPATFVATAQLAADGRGRTLNDMELTEWENFQRDLLKDPRFHQMAAERFQRVGMATMGSPSEVDKLINEHLTTEVINEGEMSLHLTGQGGRATERTLDTLAAAMASHANSMRTGTTHGGATKVSQQAQTGNEPIDNTRTFWALGMMGMGIAVCFFVATSLWRKLSGAKTAFEQDAQVAAILEDARWEGVEKRDGVKGKAA